MAYDPDKHHRRSIRLKEHDYSQPGSYFVTICTRKRECLFGHVVNGEMRLNDAGEIAQRWWEDIPHHFPRVVLDAVKVMPNHVHGIIVIRECPNGTQPGSLSAIVQNFKSVSTRTMNTTRSAPGAPVWQRGHYEHVIRNEAGLTAIREYILGNPARWDEDENNPALLKSGRCPVK